MRKSNQILQKFFYKINDSYILNVLYVLSLVLNIEDHKDRLQEILDIRIPGTSLDDFTKAVKQEIQHYEDLLEENTAYLMKNIVTGSAINVIQDTPIIWCFMALYWAYDFKHKDQISILSVYNPTIGDIALKFLLYLLKMKQKEAHIGCAEHKNSFYEDLSARLVRIIDILPVMDARNSYHLRKLYLPTDTSDLAQNFLQVQVNNPWERTVLSVAEDQRTGKNIIHYLHKNENLNFIIRPSRMTKDGAFRDLDKTLNQLMQLYNLDPASSRTRYIRRNKQNRLNITPIIIELEEELIYEYVDIDSEILTNDDQIEQISKRKAYRRDMKDFYDTDKDSEEKVKEYVIPNAFRQHKRNIAFSSTLSKQKLLLRSNYDIPMPEHLKAFIKSLDTEGDANKIYTNFFILNVALGCKMQDLMHLLEENKEGPLSLKNGLLSVNTDSSLFSSNFSELLSQSDDILSFNIPITMAMLIAAMKKTILAKEFDKDIFFEGYKEFIKKSVKAFPKRITIRRKQIHRYLAQYMQEHGSDVLTGKLATASYSQNDTAKLAYTSSRSNASEHSSLIQNYWDELGLSEVASNILDINTIFSTNVFTIASEKFSGTSQAVEISEADVFFKALRENIYDQYSCEDLHFNLVSIYVRYAMSLLSGTRPFEESANFTSYNNEIGMWMISEKSQDIASGTRLVPLCDIMSALLNDYQKLLDERDLKNNFYLIVDSKPIIFSAYRAHEILQNTNHLIDCEIIKQYIVNVPLNTGRHLFTREAIDQKVSEFYIATFLGHYSATEEQFGIYSTLNVVDYYNVIINITSKIAQECGIKEL